MVIRKILSRTSNQRLLFDAIAFHFYDRANKLAPRIELYRDILSRLGLPSIKINITEIGKLEGYAGRWLSEEEQARVIIQNLSIIAHFIDQQKVANAFWHTGYMAPLHDPFKHSLTRLLIKNGRQVLVPKAGFMTFLGLWKLLHHNITFEYRGKNQEVTVVKGQTSQGNQVIIAWYNHQTKPGVEGRLVIYLDHQQIPLPF